MKIDGAPRRHKNLPRVYFNTGKHIIEVEHSRESFKKGKLDERFIAGVEAASAEFFRVAWPEDGKPAPRAAKELFELHSLAEYHEDCGTVLWWHLPIQEPPCVGAGPGMCERRRDGTPTTCAWLLADGWLTHWSLIPHSLGWLIGDINNGDGDITQQDAMVAATMMQWLGSNVGWSFLQEALKRAGYQIVRAEEAH